MQESQFWLIPAFALLVRVLIAYVLALLIYLVIYRLSHSTLIPYIDESMRPGIFGLLMVVAVLAMLVPLAQSNWSAASRGFALMTAGMLTAIILAQALGFSHFDPGAPPSQLLQSYAADWSERLQALHWPSNQPHHK